MESCLNKSESDEILKPTFNLNDHNEVLLDKVRYTTLTTSPNQVDLVYSSQQNPTVLFILVIIVDDFPHESIWRLWIEHWELQQQQQQQLHLCSMIDTSADDVDTHSLKNTIVDEIVCNSAKNMSSVVDSLYDSTTSQPCDDANIHQLPCQNVPLSAPVRFLFHAKHPEKITRPWVKDRMVKTFQKKPTWGSLELTEVMLCMLEEARS